jgi:hypothetical protein
VPGADGDHRRDGAQRFLAVRRTLNDPGRVTALPEVWLARPICRTLLAEVWDSPIALFAFLFIPVWRRPVAPLSVLIGRLYGGCFESTRTDDFNLNRLTSPAMLLLLLFRQHGRQKPEFGPHFGGIDHSIGDFLAKELAIPLAKPVNGHLERSF